MIYNQYGLIMCLKYNIKQTVIGLNVSGCNWGYINKFS